MVGMSDEVKLTFKQDKFVNEFMKDTNATQAALRAGYSKDSSRQIGSENLSKPYIKEAIGARMSKQADKLGIDAEFVLNRLKYWSEKDNQELASASIKSTELLGKHLKMFGEQIEVSVKSHEEALKELE